MAFITAKVWISLQRTDNTGTFYNLPPKSNETQNPEEKRDTFLKWFTKTAFTQCCQYYKSIRSTRHRSIWKTRDNLDEEAKVQRDRSRKRVVSSF